MKKWFILLGIFMLGFLSHLYLVYVFKTDIKPTYSVSTFMSKPVEDVSASAVFPGYLKLVDITCLGDSHAQNKVVIKDLFTSRQMDYYLNSVLPYGGEITQILKDRIVIKKGGQEKTLGLLESLDDPEAREFLLAHGYKKVAQAEWLLMPGHLNLDKGVENNLLAAEITPHFTKGIQRFRIDSFPQGSLFEELGFKQGDSIVTIDGEELTDIQHILRVCWKIRNSSLIIVDVERNHHPIRLSYRIISEKGGV